MVPGSSEGRASIAIGITGASGALYATRTLAALLERGVHVELIVSDYGRRLLRDELGEAATVDRLIPYLTDRYGAGVAAGSLVVHNNRDQGATLASGSHGCRGMAIVPCSMKTLAAVAHGLSRNLIERAADVMLKERRPLLLVPRETPLSAIHLENMLKLARAGAVILPPSPGFYGHPQSIADLVDFVVARILDQLGVSHTLGPRWGARGGQAPFVERA
jgi:flavin prenyltransferase